MKFTVMFKTPDALHHALKDVAEQSEDDVEQARELAEKFIEYDEYITIEFDTETGTATVRTVD